LPWRFPWSRSALLVLLSILLIFLFAFLILLLLRSTAQAILAMEYKTV
jgi:hypothetical protein